MLQFQRAAQGHGEQWALCRDEELMGREKEVTSEADGDGKGQSAVNVLAADSEVGKMKAM